MPGLEILDFRIPEWIQIFVLVGIGFVLIAVPLRIIWAATKGARAHAEKMDQFGDRLRERFNEVKAHRGIIGPTSFTFKHEGRRYSVTVHDMKSLVMRLEDTPSPKLPCVIKTKGRCVLPWAMVGLRVLPRVEMYDSTMDDAVIFYAGPIFGSYVRDSITDAVTIEGKPSSIVESVIVLRRLAGVRKFRLWTVPEGAMCVKLALRTEDVFYRPDALESVAHHMAQLYDRFVKY